MTEMADRRPWFGTGAVLLLPIFLLSVLLFSGLPQPAASGQPSEPAISEARFLSSDGTVLAVNAWLPEKAPQAVILALHGFNDYSMAFDGAARAWAKHGFAVYAYDQRGFGDTVERGRWAGTARMVADAKAALEALRRLYPERRSSCWARAWAAPF